MILQVSLRYRFSHSFDIIRNSPDTRHIHKCHIRAALREDLDDDRPIDNIVYIFAAHFLSQGLNSFTYFIEVNKLFARNFLRESSIRFAFVIGDMDQPHLQWTSS